MKPRVYHLPKNARQLIITYQANDIGISILCDAHQKTIRTAFVSDSGGVTQSQLCINIPELCLTHLLQDDQYLLNVHQNGQFAPYILANVYDYGAICFGDFFDHCPKDLRQAWNYYWETPFNQENSEYYEYHKAHCSGVSTHSYAGHRSEQHCICACCVEICNCPCYCVQSVLFEQYLTNYGRNAFLYAEDTAILTNKSMLLNVLSPQLVILPKNFAPALGLKESKYPDIFFFVLREDEATYHCTTENTTFQIPKAWIKNGTPE